MCVCVFVFLLSWFKWKSPIILQNIILEDMKRGKLSVKLTVLALIISVLKPVFLRLSSNPFIL